MSSVSLFIGLRYLRSRRRNGFVTFVSAFAGIGMALGVFALIVVMSVMNGFDQELEERILRAVPHAFLTRPEGMHRWRDDAKKIASFPSLRGASPYITGQVLIGRSGINKGVELYGVDPDQEQKVSEVANYMVAGELKDLNSRRYGIVLGSLLANSLGVGLGDSVEVTLADLSITPAGIFPREKKFRVVGVFEIGAQADEFLALINLHDAQVLFRRGDSVDGLRLRFDDIYRAPGELQQLLQQLGTGYSGRDWSQTQGSLFHAVKLEKNVTELMLSIIIAVAAFNIVTSLVMMVAEKRGDIAVLRTMGMGRRDIMLIFLVQGSATGLSGVLGGLLFGIPVALFLPDIMSALEHLFGFTVFDPDVYFVTQLPSVWHFQDTAVVCVIAALMSCLSAIYPAYRASKIEPAEALRYEL